MKWDRSGVWLVLHKQRMLSGITEEPVGRLLKAIYEASPKMRRRIRTGKGIIKLSSLRRKKKQRGGYKIHGGVGREA